MDGGERYLCRSLIIAFDYTPAHGVKQMEEDEKDPPYSSSFSFPYFLVTLEIIYPDPRSRFLPFYYKRANFQ